MNNIYCVVGPSGCGKTTLVEALKEKYGFNVIESYTTRAPRFEGETGHIFVSPEEFRALGEMVAYTKFDGHEYGVTADLIEQNDLYVIDPAGVEFLREKYNGKKGVKVIGLEADANVLVERMLGRGDSEEKVISRLVNDAEAFKHLDLIANITLRTDINSVDELCDAIKYHIDSYENLTKHWFGLFDEQGKEIGEKRFYNYNEALEDLKRSYPSGVPEGWTLRDNTEIERQAFVKAIKKARPSFKTSMIEVNMENSWRGPGRTCVDFNYNGKNYIYRDDWNSKPWIEQKVRKFPDRFAERRLGFQIDLLEKKKNNAKENIKSLETGIEFLKKAIDVLKTQKNNDKALAEKLAYATERSKETECKVQSQKDFVKE